MKQNGDVVKYKKLVVGLSLGCVAYLGMALLVFTQLETRQQAATPKSVWMTPPLFIYTDTITGCKYIYDSIFRDIRTAKGFEQCVIPNTLE